MILKAIWAPEIAVIVWNQNVVDRRGYNPNFQETGLKGGNFTFNFAGVTVQGQDLYSAVTNSGSCANGIGDSVRCGDWNSIHFNHDSVHLDTANPFNPILAPVHIIVDGVLGKTIWKDGIPR